MLGTLCDNFQPPTPTMSATDRQTYNSIMPTTDSTASSNTIG